MIRVGDIFLYVLYIEQLDCEQWLLSINKQFSSSYSLKFFWTFHQKKKINRVNEKIFNRQISPFIILIRILILLLSHIWRIVEIGHTDHHDSFFHFHCCCQYINLPLSIKAPQMSLFFLNKSFVVLILMPSRLSNKINRFTFCFFSK